MVWRLILSTLFLLATPILVLHPRLRCSLKDRLALYPALPPKRALAVLVARRFRRRLGDPGPLGQIPQGGSARK